MAQAKYKRVKGMSDIVPPESYLWNYIEDMARRVFGSFGVSEIRTPIVEKTELFVRSVGETTAIVEKEMYSFLDRNEESLSLRPEATASVVRAYIESCASDGTLAKFYYMGPMFRYERPQKGRKRQFNQIGVEVFGAADPAVDAEVMAMCHTLFLKLGIRGFDLEINSIGCKECRPGYHKIFLDFLKRKAPHLCADCMKRIEKNPLRAFDCKVPECRVAMKDAPEIGTHLCAGCKAHFSGVQKYLKLLKIPFKVNHRIVRGLDYYVKTAFEFTTDDLGAQNAISAGGRYDGLVEAMGGADTPGIGFSIGVERMILLMEKLGVRPNLSRDILFFAVLGDKAREKIFPIIDLLRSDGINCDWDYQARSLKAQLRFANKLGAHTVVMVGDREVEEGKVMVKNMEKGEQKEVKLEDLPRLFVHVDG